MNIFRKCKSFKVTCYSFRMKMEYFCQLKVSTELLITAIDVIFLFPPKNILLRSITRNIVTEHTKGGLETRPLQGFS